MSVDGIVGNAPTMGIPTSEIKKITEVGLYDPNLRGELIDCKDWEMEHVESFITSLDEQHDLFLPIGFMESIEKDPAKFIRIWVENPNKEINFVIEEALSKNILRKNRATYYFGTDVIGNGVEDVVAFLKDKKNQDIYLAIM